MTEKVKLVRDNIPAILEKLGYSPSIRTLQEDEYREALFLKLQEEIAEFLLDQETEELADILEVLIAIAKLNQVSEEELLQLRKRKKEEKGGFDKRILLIRNE